MKPIQSYSRGHFAFEWRIVTIIDTPSSFCLLTLAGSLDPARDQQATATRQNRISVQQLTFMVHPRQDPFISELVHRLSSVASRPLLPFSVWSAFIPLTPPPRAVLPSPSLFIVSVVYSSKKMESKASLTRLEDDIYRVG